MLASERPYMLSVRTANQELAMPPKIKIQQAKGFSLFILKAILNGDGHALVELGKTHLFR